jgi:phytoene dehydrogenase-like protein
MRPGWTALVPLLRYLPTLVQLIQTASLSTGTFGPYMDGPIYTVRSPWLRNWLDALAFSLSGLPANRTVAAAMAFVVNDMHRPNATLDYPVGGMGTIVDALVQGIIHPNNNNNNNSTMTTRSKVNLQSHVESIDFNDDATRVTGITLRKNKRKIKTRLGVICNAPLWTLQKLIHNENARNKLKSGKSKSNTNEKTKLQQSFTQSKSSWNVTKEGSSIQIDRPVVEVRDDNNDKNNDLEQSFLEACQDVEMTGSFLHLHVALNATGLDLSTMEAHYTYMDRSLNGDPNLIVNGILAGPCGELNMIAVSNPCQIDPTLAPPGYIIVHAYGAANEPYEIWKKFQQQQNSDNTTSSTKAAYRQLKESRASVLYRAIASIIPDWESRCVLKLIGSPLTHERFLRRPNGTYGAATEDYLPDGCTPFDNLILANDGIFPGIGVPAVAIAGASAANHFVSVQEQWSTITSLQRQGKI